MWEVFKDWIFNVIEFFFNFCGDWGLAIIIVTVIFRIILAPLMHKQAKSNFQMQKIQPKIAAIQQKYADDQVRQSQEMQKLYADAKFNPLAGCVPMLLQMPIFIALFQTLREMGARPEVAGNFTFYNIVPNLTMTTNEHRQIIAGDVQNELSLVTLVLVNGNLADVEVLQDVLKCSNGRISDVVEHLIGDLRLLAFLDNLSSYVLFFHGVSFHIKQKECFT